MEKGYRCRVRNRASPAVQASFDHDNDSDNEKILGGKTIYVLYINNPDAKRRSQLLAMTSDATFYGAIKAAAPDSTGQMKRPHRSFALLGKLIKYMTGLLGGNIDNVYMLTLQLVFNPRRNAK